jgi:hemin uptake protein HemP
MDLPLQAPRAHDGSSNVPDADFPVADSVELMKGRRELKIRHGSQTYRLRLTASDKLILTK